MPKNFAKGTILFLFAGLLGLSSLKAVDTSLDGERLSLESQMQRRVEEALNKLLEPWQFVVVIRVEPVPKSIAAEEDAPEEKDGVFLTGVRARRKMDGSAEAIKKRSDQL